MVQVPWLGLPHFCLLSRAHGSFLNSCRGDGVEGTQAFSQTMDGSIRSWQCAVFRGLWSMKAFGTLNLIVSWDWGATRLFVLLVFTAEARGWAVLCGWWHTRRQAIQSSRHPFQNALDNGANAHESHFPMIIEILAISEWFAHQFCLFHRLCLCVQIVENALKRI